MYRDFQSRNILLHSDKLYFIDYQGGRKGPLQYDLASLLFDAKANLSADIRSELSEYYIQRIKLILKTDDKEFTQFYHAIVLIRMMQAFGAYGYRGYYERKSHFLQSIPYAINNLEWMVNNAKLPIELPELYSVFNKLIHSNLAGNIAKVENNKLTISINSFSYFKTIPEDKSGNGGGFIFDCRFLPNPGRLDEFKEKTGNDPEVIKWLEQHKETHEFINHVKAIVDMAIKNYSERNFTNLMISFGCTGGRHRSVYCAQLLAKYLHSDNNISVVLKHLEVLNL